MKQRKYEDSNDLIPVDDGTIITDEMGQKWKKVWTSSVISSLTISDDEVEETPSNEFKNRQLGPTGPG